ncbi:conserved hypothetical protein [Rhizobium sp. EC-SD404]|nr:conserved hypothetical protein [Rhizobium sp. EC-SD404]
MISFPIVFVIINIRALNRRYPLDGRTRGGETTARRGVGDRDLR